MSDVSLGPGWWMASDGKWYPPESAPATSVPPPAPEQPKKPLYKRVWFWLLLVVVLGCGGCTAVVVAAGTAVDKDATTKHTIVYVVTGNGSADITYATFGSGAGGISSPTGQGLPWTKTFIATGILNAYNVGATLTSGSTVTCSISVDGKVLSSKTATGTLASADCSAAAA